MKLMFLLLAFGFVPRPEPKLVLIDRQLKDPVVHASEFTFDQYLHQSFPIYAEDMTAIIAAAETVAKKLQQKMTCYQWDTVIANHTQFIVYSDCDSYQSLSVRMTTRIEEQDIFCSFTLVNGEGNYRKIQRTLLAFSDYLTKNK